VTFLYEVSWKAGFKISMQIQIYVAKCAIRSDSEADNYDKL
jgi:hypothetical protein